MNDYVRAYKKITPLLEDDDRQLQKITDLTIKRERDRSLFSINRLYRKPHVTNWENMSEILDITPTLNKVMRQESSMVQHG